MNKIKFLSLLLMVFLLIPNGQGMAQNGPSTQPQISEVTPEAVDEFVSQYLADAMEIGHAPGVVVAVVYQGEVMLLKGYGVANLAEESPMTPQTVVRAGSVSKPVTATAVMQLVEQGVLDLDAPVSDYITDIDLSDEFGPASTIAQLLTMEGGYTDTVVLSHSPTYEDWQPLSEFLADNMIPRTDAPGTVLSYSSWNTALLGYAMEHVSGKRYEDVIADNLLKPLGMENSTYEVLLPDPIASALAQGYGYVGGGEYAEVPYDYVKLSPGVALVTTAEDMSQYILALLNGGTLDGVQVLKPETVDMILTRQASAHEYSRGRSYGYSETTLNDREVMYHDGNGIGFASRLVLDPKNNFGFFISVNHRTLGLDAGPTPASRMIRDLSGALMEEFIPATEITIPTVQPLDDAAERVSRYVGNYRLAGTPQTDFFKLNALLDNASVKDGGDGTIVIGSNRYEEVEPLLFRSTTNHNFFVVFIENEEGEVTHLTFGGTGSYKKVKWYETPSFMIGVVGLMLVSFLSMAIAWPFSRKGHWAFWAASIVNLAFIVGLAVMMLKADILLFFKEIPLKTQIVFVLPWVNVLLTLSLVVLVRRVWQDAEAKLLTKAHYGLVATAGLISIWFAGYWNLFL